MTPEVDIVVGVESGDWPEEAEHRAIRAAETALITAQPTDFTQAELSVVLADDALVHRLNRDYRGKDKPTNVLSFALTEGDAGPEPEEGMPIMLGDVILAYETVRHEAETQRKSFDDHLTHLVIHGVLHLLGYDHETDEDADHMERLEVKALARLGIADPYAGPEADPGRSGAIDDDRSPTPPITP